MLATVKLCIIILYSQCIQTRCEEISSTRVCNFSLSSCISGNVRRYFKAGSSPCDSTKGQCARSFQVSVVM